MLINAFCYKMWWFLIFITLLARTCVSQFRQYAELSKISYEIVGIFDNNAHTERLAFNESMNHVNVLTPIILNTKRSDSFTVWTELCSSSANGNINPIAIFGPQNPISDGTIRDQCMIANIPHIQATWQPIDTEMDLIETEEKNEEDATVENKEEDNNDENVEENTKDESENSAFKKITINYYPNSDEIALAYGKLLKYYRWTSFAALYEDNFGLLRIQKILSEITHKSRITVHKLDPNTDNRGIFKHLKKYQDISRFLLDCHADRITKYMKEASELNMVNDYQHYILVSMDTTVEVENIMHLPSNITWMSMMEYNKVTDRLHPLASRVGKWSDPPNLSANVAKYEVEALIMEDVANHLAKALNKTELNPQPFRCTNEDPWDFGAELQKQILETKTIGVTGNIEFDKLGRRKNYVLYVNEIHGSVINTVGKWDSAEPDAIIETQQATAKRDALLSSKHFKIISREAEPYFIEKKKCPEDAKDCVEENADPNYEGFSVDLIKEIFTFLKEEKYNFTYEFISEQKYSYGKMDPKTKKWDGLIGELLDQKADLAVCDLTITEERKKVVDFSVPFMTLGISILYTREREVPPELFSFLNPYNFEVWMYIATAYCVVSIILFICARISPADWENPEPCEKDPEELENIWTFKNCTWMTMGSIMTQGCDILPKAIGTRWVCAMWWFFTVIVCQTYIAQLSASMTSALVNEPINSVEDLAKQTKVLYGAVKDGSTLEFFRSSKDKTFRRMYETMMKNPAVLLNSNDEGEKRVSNYENKYAFFMESSTIEYKLKRNCNLNKVGGELDSKDYGIAMPANSPFRKHINRAILKLKELTKLDKIKKKWWNEKYVDKPCEVKTDKNDVEGDLEIENLSGLFLVLAVGLVFCLFLTAIEFMNEVRNIVVKEQVTYKEVFIKELKASLNFFQLQKPVIRNPSRVPSVAASLSSDNGERDKRTESIENFLKLEKLVQ